MSCRYIPTLVGFVVAVGYFDYFHIQSLLKHSLDILSRLLRNITYLHHSEIGAMPGWECLN